MLRQFRPPLFGRQDDALGGRAVAQPDDRPRRRRKPACPRSSTTPRSSGVGDYPNYLSIALGAGDTTVPELVNAYAILANQGRSVKPTIDRLCPGPQRQGHLPHRQSLRADGQLQRARLGRQGDAAAAQPHPPADRPDGRVPDGPYPGRRGRARHRDRAARPRPAAVRQDRNDHRARPTCGSSAARPTSSPESISATTSRAPIGGYAQGGRIAAPIFKQWAKIALKDQPKVPFVAPAGIRWVRVDRASRQAGLWHLPDQRGPQVVGDLGSVPAADRAAPRLPPLAGGAQGEERCSGQRQPAPAPASAPARPAATRQPQRARQPAAAPLPSQNTTR